MITFLYYTVDASAIAMYCYLGQGISSFFVKMKSLTIYIWNPSSNTTFHHKGVHEKWLDIEKNSAWHDNGTSNPHPSAHVCLMSGYTLSFVAHNLKHLFLKHFNSFHEF